MTLPSFMRAVQVLDEKGAEALKIGEVALPQIGDEDVLIKVAASGINRPDLLQRDGLYPAPKGHSPILGLEVSGVVVAVGPMVSDIQMGEQVAALVNGGGYAEYCSAHHGSVLPIPNGLVIDEAAGLPETFFTVWHNVFERGHLKAGDWLLVHGGTSGIGTTAIQMAKAFAAKVIVTAGSDEKCEACLSLGADAAINYKSQDFVERTKELTEGRGVDVILDMVGGDYIERNFAAAAVEGRIVQIAFLSGAKYEVNFVRLMLKRLTLTGSTLRVRSNEVKAGIANELRKNIWPLLENGTIKPIIAKKFPFEDVVEAHKLMESSQHIGKILLTQ